MAFYRPGDIVQVIEPVLGNHPNFKRKLQIGDKILVDKVHRIKEKKMTWGGGPTTNVSLGYLTSEGEAWIEGKYVRLAYKGNKEDCIKFLRKHGRKPRQHREREHLVIWTGIRLHSDIDNPSYIPHHLHRHIKVASNSHRNQTESGTLHLYFEDEEEAFKAASMAWLRMTAAQQQFFNAVHSLHEINP